MKWHILLTNRIDKMKPIKIFICIVLTTGSSLINTAFAASSEECVSAWKKSDAYHSCSTIDRYINVTESGSCKIDKLTCSDGGGGSVVYNDATRLDGHGNRPAKIETLENVEQLKNCKGDLRVSC